ncbi:MAG: hypothetical protein WAM60_08745 [Candidatus Promineifilaceae bacterium]
MGIQKTLEDYSMGICRGKELGNEFEPKADKPTAGSADLCFITQTPLDEVVAVMKSAGIEIIEGLIQK